MGLGVAWRSWVLLRAAKVCRLSLQPQNRRGSAVQGWGKVGLGRCSDKIAYSAVSIYSNWSHPHAIKIESIVPRTDRLHGQKYVQVLHRNGSQRV